MTNYYVTKNSNGGWNAKREGATRVSGTFEYQAQAEKAAKNLCHNSGGGEVRIQGRDYKFRDSDTVTPGNEAFPPRDKKH